MRAGQRASGGLSGRRASLSGRAVKENTNENFSTDEEPAATRTALVVNFQSISIGA